MFYTQINRNLHYKFTILPNIQIFFKDDHSMKSQHIVIKLTVKRQWGFFLSINEAQKASTGILRWAWLTILFIKQCQTIENIKTGVMYMYSNTLIQENQLMYGT